MDKVTLGGRIHEARKKTRLTSERVAELCDCTPTTIRAIESGSRLPSVPKLVSLCNVLKISPNELLGKEITFSLVEYEKLETECLQKMALRLQRLPKDKQEFVCAVMEFLISQVEAF